MAIYDIHGNVISSGGGGTAEVIEPIANDIPVVCLDGTLPTSKADGTQMVTMHYKSKGREFTSYITAAVQGDSSTAYPKKNFTVKLFKDSGRSTKLKQKFLDWDERNKFVLKANWVDHSHARNVVNARIWSQIVKARSDYSSLPTELVEGHKAVDGFLIRVYNNGIYQGLYTMNLPKDSLYGLDEDVDTNVIMQADGNTDGTYWKSATVANWDDETHDAMPQVVATNFTNLIDFVNTSTDANFVANFETHFDKQSVIDMIIFLNVCCVVDNVGKNQTYFSYDAEYWYAGMYDMDATYGLPPMPTAASQSLSDYYSYDKDLGLTNNKLFSRVMSLFSSDYLARYEELRQAQLSEDNIIGEFDRFIYLVRPSIFAEESAQTTAGGAYSDIPFKNIDQLSQIKNFVVARCAYLDEEILGA